MAEKLTEPKFKRRLLATFFVRFHMTLILGAVGISGVAISKTLLVVGVSSMWARYFIAVIVAYAGFFLLMRMWLWYIGISPHARRQLAQSQSRSSSFDVGEIPLDLGSLNRGSGGGSGWTGFGGGSSRGGGAGDSWMDQADPNVKTSAIFDVKGSGSSAGKGSFDFDLDLGDDGCLGIIVLLLLIALILGVAGAGIYLIYQAPVILAEAAFQAAMAAGLVKATNRMDQIGWTGSVWEATWVPFAILLITATAFGWAAQEYCPEATKMAEVFTNCR